MIAELSRGFGSAVCPCSKYKTLACEILAGRSFSYSFLSFSISLPEDPDRARCNLNIY